MLNANPKGQTDTTKSSSGLNLAMTLVMVVTITDLIVAIIYGFIVNSAEQATILFLEILIGIVPWLVITTYMSSETQDQIRKRRSFWLLTSTLLYMILVGSILFILGIGIYNYLFPLIFNTVNAGFLFTGTLLTLGDLRTAKSLTNSPKKLFWLPSITIGVLTLIGLLGLIAARYSTVVPQTTSGWSDYATSSEPYERKVSIEYYLNSSDLSSLNHMLLDTNSSVADTAYNAIWKLHKEESIPILLEYLRTTTDELKARSLAEDYVNSGNSILEAAGTAWARDHGYEIISQPSANDSRKWSN
jgi:hypothetical protein